MTNYQMRSFRLLSFTVFYFFVTSLDLSGQCYNTVVPPPGQSFNFPSSGDYNIEVTKNCGSPQVYNGIITFTSNYHITLNINGHVNTTNAWSTQYNLNIGNNQIFTEYFLIGVLSLPTDHWDPISYGSDGSGMAPLEMRLAYNSSGFYEGDYGIWDFWTGWRQDGKILIHPCEDADTDGICDSVDPCVGSYDECGVCNGNNSTCLDCAGVPNGNSEADNCGTCDNHSWNDCFQDCAGNWGGTAVLDECNVCGGPGSIYACGCSPMPSGHCDCAGNVHDVIGICGGNCAFDLDGDGVCDGWAAQCVNSIVTAPGEFFDFPHGLFDIFITSNCASSNPTGYAGTISLDPTSDIPVSLNINGITSSNTSNIEWVENFTQNSHQTDGDQLFVRSLFLHNLILPNGFENEYQQPFVMRLVSDNNHLEGDYGWYFGGFHAAGKVLIKPCNSHPNSNCDCFGHQDDVVNICGGDCLVDIDGDGVCEVNQSCSNSVVEAPGQDFALMHGTYEVLISSNCIENTQMFSGTLISDPNADPKINLTIHADYLSGNFPEVTSSTSGFEWHENYNMNGHQTAIDQVFNKVLFIHELSMPDWENNHIATSRHVRLAQNNGYYEGDYGFWHYGFFKSLGKILVLPCEDTDEDGICDTVDPCVGFYDACNVCNGPGSTYDCGCSPIPSGYCDCEYHLSDAIGVCGGTCLSDTDGNGTCDDSEIYGCMSPDACNFNPNATRNQSCDFCTCRERISRNTFTVESSEALSSALTIHRLYVNLNSEQERVVSISGTPQTPFTLSAPNGIFNSPFNGSWSAQGLSPYFLSIYPEMADDSYVTIGLDSPASTDLMDNEYAPSLIGNSIDLQAFFAVPQISNLQGNSLLGWYVNPQAANASQDADGRVLIAQLTSSGEVSGSLNVLFSSSVNSSDIWSERFVFSGQGTYGNGHNNSQCGCTDSGSSNYDLNAIYDDETCIADLTGCTNDQACGFNPLASLDDGSCILISDNDLDEDGICDDIDECVGEFDECGICNGGGVLLGECNCEGHVLDDCGVCGGDGSSCLGCSNSSACNYTGATIDDGSCEFCSCEPASGNYSLIVESSPSVQSGFTTYRLNIVMNHHNDRLIAVFGTEDSPLQLNAPQGVFNHAYSTSWNASGLNPAFFTSFPNMADDSFATIGLDEPAGTSTMAGSVDPTLIDDELGSVQSFFTIDGSSTLSTGSDGALWFVLSDVANGLPSSNLQMLVMQITTSGSLSGVLNARVLPSGATQTEDVGFTFENSGSFMSDISHPCGCIDSSALNYDAGATISNNSCVYSNTGCTDASSCNFNPIATEDDGSCEYDSCVDCCGILYGDGSTCDGSCGPCNDDTSCIDICDDGDSDGDGVCDNLEISGCTDQAACNYDVFATEEDSSCEYCSCAYVSESYILNVESSPSLQAGLTTYRLHVEMNNLNDRLIAVFGTEDSPLTLNAPQGVFNHAYSTSWNASGLNPVFFTSYPYMADDSYATIGLEGPAVTSSLPGLVDPILMDDESGSVLSFFTDDGADHLLTGLDGASWFVVSDAPNGFSSSDLQMLVIQITTSGSISGVLNARILPNGTTETEDFRFAFANTGSFVSDDIFEPCGCMDETADNYDAGATLHDSCVYSGCTHSSACNYDPQATVADGSCLYPTTYFTCDGSCIHDADGDLVCDEDEISGCTDVTACNYDEFATDDYYCTYPSAYYDCNGECNNDSDGDSLCDENEVDGCTDSSACNYNPQATEADGSCLYPATYLTCDGTCIHDADGDLVCDEDEISGCTDVTACNYDEFATQDDSSCLSNNECGFCAASGSCSPLNSPLNIGDVYGGGVIFHIDYTNETYLILNTDIKWYAEWGCYGNPIFQQVGIDWPTMYGGDQNTTHIALHGSGCGAEPNAAGTVYNTNAGYLYDWYLPSVGEFFYMMSAFGPADQTISPSADQTIGNPYGLNLSDVGLDTPFAFWSSTEVWPTSGDPATQAFIWFPLHGDGSTNTNEGGYGIANKNQTLGVVAVRKQAWPISCLDECGVCGGSGIADGYCDCDGNQLDALGVCGGSCSADADTDGVCDDIDDCVGSLDECGVYDCAGVLHGTSWESDCGCVPASNSGNDCDDCAGAPYGTSWESDCGCVPASNSGDDCDDCAGVPNGHSWESDCGCVGADNSGDDCDDCAGVPNGDFYVDNCGTCDYDPSNDCVQDCAGVWGGDSILDAIGVCGGDCSIDADSDGVCDDNEVVGCQDATACNYNFSATDSGSCTYVVDALGVCGGDCPDDYNGNGICDTEDLYGCTYLEASNYNSEATSDDGSCFYEDCDPNAGFDAGFDAGVEFVDCPDENSCPSDLDGNGHVSTADLLLFLSDFGSVCE